MHGSFDPPTQVTIIVIIITKNCIIATIVDMSTIYYKQEKRQVNDKIKKVHQKKWSSHTGMHNRVSTCFYCTTRTVDVS